MKRPQRIVFLVPGFFGFTAVGDLSYFHDVERTLGEGLKRRGFAARLVRCQHSERRGTAEAALERVECDDVHRTS